MRAATQTDNYELPPFECFKHIESLAENIDSSRIVAEALKDRLNTSPKVAIRVLKTLLTIEYVVHVGPDAIATAFQNHVESIRAFENFPDQDVPAPRNKSPNVRKKARELAQLLSNNDALQLARRSAAISLGRNLARDFGKEEGTVIEVQAGPGRPSRQFRKLRPEIPTTPGPPTVDYRALFKDIDLSAHVTFDRAKDPAVRSQADIFKGVLKIQDESSVEVAVKIYRFINTVTNTQDGIKPSYKREISISHDLRHENIHRLIGLYWGQGETLPGFVSAWCPNGDIIGFLGRQEPSVALERTRLELLSQTLQGLVHLHHENDPPVVHGDIKPANILISDRGTALICDFGHARIYTETRTLDPAAVSTVRYMAPELHSEEHESSFTTKTDIWAFGTSAAQIMFRGNRLPYAAAFNDSTVCLLSEADLPFCSAGIPDRFWWWLLATWELAPDERPTAMQLLSETRPFHGILAQNAESWRGDTLPNLKSTDQFFTLHFAQRVLGATSVWDHKKQKSVQLRELYGLFDDTRWQSNAMLQALYVVLTSAGGKQWLATCCDQNGKSQDSKRRATEITQRLLNLCVDGCTNPGRCNARLFKHVARATVAFMVDERRKYPNWEPPLNVKSTLDPLFGFLDKENGCERLATKARKFFGAPLQIPALNGHTGTVRCMQFTSDGRQLVSGSNDHTLMIWDCTTGQPILPPLKGHGSHVTCLALSPDDSRIVSGGKDHHVIIWNARTGAPTCKPLGRHNDTVTCVAFARDGQRIASADARLICIWAATDSHLLATTDLAETPAPVSLSFTVGGALAWLRGSDRMLHTLCAGGEISTQELVAPKRQRLAAVHAAVLAANGATAAFAFSDHTAALVDVSARGGGALAQAHHTVPTGPPATHAKVEKPRQRPKKSARPQHVPAAPAASEEPPATPLLALAPGGHQALSSWNGTLLVLDPADECDDAQQEFEKDRPHSAIALSPEGCSAATARSGGGEYCIRIWSFGGNSTSSVAGGRAGTDPEEE